MRRDPYEIETNSNETRRHRWPFAVAGLLLIVIIGVGAWQMVDMHHQISELQTQNHREQVQIESQQNQLSGLNAAISGSASKATTTTNLRQMEGQISTLQGYTTSLAVRLGCVNQALKDATVNSNGTLFVDLIC
jgi:hypothetical protein